MGGGIKVEIIIEKSPTQKKDEAAY